MQPQKHTIIIFGGAGRTGSEVTKLALQYGHMVTVFARSQPQASVLPEHPNLRIITGDVSDYQQVLQALASHDVVINIIAPKFGDKKNYPISSLAASNIILGMQELGMQRYIGQCGAWATEFLEDASLPMRLGFRFLWPLKQIYKYKLNEDHIVKSSVVNYTIVRCALLTNGKATGKFKVFLSRYKCRLLEIPRISRKDVALFHMAIIDDERYSHRCPIIVG